jgi:hypothetical protein
VAPVLNLIWPKKIAEIFFISNPVKTLQECCDGFYISLPQTLLALHSVPLDMHRYYEMTGREDQRRRGQKAK